MALKPERSDPGKDGKSSLRTGKAKRPTGNAASRLIDEKSRSPGDWRAETLAEVRRLIREADPEITAKPVNTR